jgi:hypothetical protein
MLNSSDVEEALTASNLSYVARAQFSVCSACTMRFYVYYRREGRSLYLQTIDAVTVCDLNQC